MQRISQSIQLDSAPTVSHKHQIPQMEWDPHGKDSSLFLITYVQDEHNKLDEVLLFYLITDNELKQVQPPMGW